jgi:hypothetical protein
MEKTFFDKFVNQGMRNKRKIGAPTKTHSLHGTTLFKMVVAPETGFQRFVSTLVNACMPVLAKVTYKKHLEHARRKGLTIHELYTEEFLMGGRNMQIYGQYFHPSGLLELAADREFFQFHEEVLPGISVPPWAQNQKRHGSELNPEAEKLWSKALEDYVSETTPTSFNTYTGYRLFFNEIPTKLKFDPETELEGYTGGGDMPPSYTAPVDTRTEEGRELFDRQWELYTKMAPEVFEGTYKMYPHKMPQKIPTDPYFMRLWDVHRRRVLIEQIYYLVKSKQISEQELQYIKQHIDDEFQPTEKLLKLLAQMENGEGKENEAEGFAAVKKMFELLGFHLFQFEHEMHITPLEQFWEQFSILNNLGLQTFLEDLPFILTEPEKREELIRKIYKQKEETENKNQEEIVI